MNFTIGENDNLLSQKIYELLNLKTGDQISLEFSGDSIELKKIESDSRPILPLSKEELNKKLLKAVEKAKKGENIPEEDIFKMMREMKSSRSFRRF